jgi:hypothetical protein
MGRIKRIHINQHKIRSNKKNDEFEPVVTCKTTKSNDYGHEVAIYDKQGNEVARVIYRPHKPLPCGAKCWVESKSDVAVIEMDEDGNEISQTRVT